MVRIEVFSSPGCAKCGRAKEMLRQLVQEMPGVEWREVNVLDELDYAVGLGVLAAPSIAIDGKLMFTGLPATGKLRAALQVCLEADGRAGAA